MAKERVQVQGLGGAVPGIQPTIQRAGQYSVAQVRAPRNKLMDLADALGQVNPVLQQYTQVADIEAEQFEEELATKSPEEIQAMLQKTEGELDKQVRKGAMSWLTSPLNQKRKLKAIGALMHDEYERELKSRVENPANANVNINDLINESKDTLRQKYGTLDSMFVNDGFEGAIRNTTRKYTLAHDTISTEQARQEVKLAGKSILYNASLLDFNGEISSEQTKNIDAWWEENEGSLTPSDLFKLIEDVAVTHAARGDLDAAEKWIDYAAGHLKVGTTKIGDPDDPIDDVFGAYGAETARLRERVKEINDRVDSTDKGDAAILLQEIDAEVTNAAYAINQGETDYVASDGTPLKTIDEVQKWAIQKGQDSGNVYAQGSDLFSRIKGAINNVEALPKETKGIQLFNTQRSIRGGVSSELKEVANTILTNEDFSLMEPNLRTGQEERVPNTEYEEIAVRLQDKYVDKSLAKAIEISIGSYEVNGTIIKNASNDKRVEDLTSFNKILAEEYKQELQEILQKKKTKKETTEKVQETRTDYSYIKPTSFLKSETSYLIKDTAYDIEQALREGNDVESKRRADAYENRRGDFGGEPGLPRDLRILDSTTTTLEQKDIARRSIIIWAYASKGASFYSPQVIREGKVNIKNKEIPIDINALQDLSSVYPMISKKRIEELSVQTDPAAADIFELYNALFGTSLTEGVEEDDKAVEQFILQQKALYE